MRLALFLLIGVVFITVAHQLYYRRISKSKNRILNNLVWLMKLTGIFIFARVCWKVLAELLTQESEFIEFFANVAFYTAFFLAYDHIEGAVFRALRRDQPLSFFKELMNMEIPNRR